MVSSISMPVMYKQDVVLTIYMLLLLFNILLLIIGYFVWKRLVKKANEQTSIIIPYKMDKVGKALICLLVLNLILYVFVFGVMMIAEHLAGIDTNLGTIIYVVTAIILLIIVMGIVGHYRAQDQDEKDDIDKFYKKAILRATGVLGLINIGLFSAIMMVVTG